MTPLIQSENNNNPTKGVSNASDYYHHVAWLRTM